MDFVEILETIDRDLGLGLATGNPIPVTRNSCRVVDNILEETPEKERNLTSSGNRNFRLLN